MYKLKKNRHPNLQSLKKYRIVTSITHLTKMEKSLGVSYVIQRCTGLINALINRTINQLISDEVSSDNENESASEEINNVLMTKKIDKNEILLKHPS